MAMPVRKLELEAPVEDRLGKLEAHVEHMRSDISDLKIDVRRLNDKVDELDQRLCGKIEAVYGKTDEVETSLSGKIDEVDKRLSGKIDELDKHLSGKVDELDERLSGKVDELDKRLTGKIDELDKRLSGKIDEVDKRLTGKIDEVDKRLSGKIDSLKDSMVTEFRNLDRARLYDRVWYLLIAGSILGLMAHGFKWF